MLRLFSHWHPSTLISTILHTFLLQQHVFSCTWMNGSTWPPELLVAERVHSCAVFNSFRTFWMDFSGRLMKFKVSKRKWPCVGQHAFTKETQNQTAAQVHRLTLQLLRVPTCQLSSALVFFCGCKLNLWSLYNSIRYYSIFLFIFCRPGEEGDGDSRQKQKEGAASPDSCFFSMWL